MKRFTQILSLFAMAAAVVSCENADLENSSPVVDGNTEAGAYVSVTVVAPTTRAETNVGVDKLDGDEVIGETDENTVSDLILVAFDKLHNFIGVYTDVYKKDADSFTFEVAPDAYKFFAIVNVDKTNEAALYSYILSNTSMWSDATSIQDAMTYAASLYSESGDFIMVSAGEYGNALTSIAEEELSTDSTDPTELSISVDRLVAKFSFYVPTNFTVSEDNAKGSTSSSNSPEGAVLGVKLTATNNSSYLYSYITDPAVSGSKGDYRIDPNMRLTEADFYEEDGMTPLDRAALPLWWIDNADFVASDSYDPFIGFATGDAGVGASSEYVLENTAEALYYNSSNLTQAVVKARFVPSAIIDSEGTNYKGSWFAINTTTGTQYMTFEDVVAYYNAIVAAINNSNTDDDTANQAIVDAMDAQLSHILGTSKKWSDADLKVTALDEIKHGGYVAATVADEKNYIVQYYQFGLNYYDVFIQHDSAQDIGHLGRWGMVHNNMYELTISSISAPGLPYIPDPTDPKIVDPQNPTPKDPEPADKGYGYIDATVVVNPWTFWEQSADLGGSDFEKN